MKTVLVCFLFIGLALAKPARDDEANKAKLIELSRGCIYVNGRCTKPCPVGTHAYTMGCGYLTPQATCANPEPKQETRGKVCDYSACYCDAPTVRDEKTNQCVTVDKCTE